MKNLGNELIKGLEEAVDYVRGKKGRALTHTHKVIVKDVDIKAIRHKMHLSRIQFAAKYGFSHRTLQHWEQGDRKPHGAARILLIMLAKNPKAVEQALEG